MKLGALQGSLSISLAWNKRCKHCELCYHVPSGPPKVCNIKITCKKLRKERHDNASITYDLTKK